MTDEEKAEEYATEDLPDGYTKINYVKKRVYLDGLAEGRKETESHLLENWCRNEDDYCPHLKKLEAQIEKMKLERSEFVDEIIDTAKGYGLVCDSCLFSLINDYDNKRISYDELLEKLQNDVIRELKLAIDDLRNGECVE